MKKLNQIHANSFISVTPTTKINLENSKWANPDRKPPGSILVNYVSTLLDLRTSEKNTSFMTLNYFFSKLPYILFYNFTFTEKSDSVYHQCIVKIIASNTAPHNRQVTRNWQLSKYTKVILLVFNLTK